VTLSVDIHRLTLLPRLAWVLKLEGNRADVGVGSRVAVAEDSLFDGGYAFTSDPADLKPDAVYFGSGASWRDGKMTLIAPSHTFEGIWVVESASAVWASNSYPLVVAASQPCGFDIRRARLAIRAVFRGVSAGGTEVYRSADTRVLRCQNAFVELGGPSGLSERQQCQALRFSDYETYTEHLRTVLREVRASFSGNGFSAHASRGYDSAASAVLAASAGPTSVISVARTCMGQDDDGSIIGELLSLPIHRIDRPVRQTLVREFPGELVVAETIAPADHANVFEFFDGYTIGDEVLSVPNEVVADRVVVNGRGGDLMWDAHGAAWNDFVRPDRSSHGGGGLSEYRLRAGFANVPLPAVAFNHADVVRRISLDAEMAPWRLGTDYDRPVPRRVIEEAGVPRGLFGERKMHVSTFPANIAAIAPRLFQMQMDRYAPALAEWAKPGGQPIP